jgi:hypothetical protein
MRCPKCKTPNPTGATECDGCGVGFADIRRGDSSVDLQCVWNDHGYRCVEKGSMSDGILGYGPWYCSDHFWRLKGHPVRHGTGHTSVRQRWYEERGLPYQPPPKGFGSVRIPERAPMRQPGEDEREAA